MSFLQLFLTTTVISSVIADSLPEIPDLEWSKIGNNEYTGELTFELGEISGNSYSWLGRTFNGIFPGPTIRFKPNGIYHLTVTNNLGPDIEPEGETLNTFHEFNSTNIHLHGVHISNEGNSDNPFVIIEPGESFTYTYRIPCDHAGGTFHYHAHKEGSGLIQVNAGAGGMIIIEEDWRKENIPNWLRKMPEKQIVISLHRWEHIYQQYLRGRLDITLDNVNDIEALGSNNGDITPSTNFTDIRINGIHNPEIYLTSNKWFRFRILYIDTDLASRVFIQGCEGKLISKDGILVANGVPRDWDIENDGLFFTSANRVDLAIKCPQGEYDIIIRTRGEDDILFERVIGTINSQNSNNGKGSFSDEDDDDDILEVFYPRRPHYLTSLVNYDGGFVLDEEFGVTFHRDIGKFGINGVVYPGADYTYPTELIAEEYVQMSIIRTHASSADRGWHPIHLHVNPFQVVTEPQNPRHELNIPTGWTQIGDWYDTIADIATVRYHVSRYGGHYLFHCHILHHQELGGKTVFFANGGCDNNHQNFDESDITCRYQSECEIWNNVPSSDSQQQSTS